MQLKTGEVMVEMRPAALVFAGVADVGAQLRPVTLEALGPGEWSLSFRGGDGVLLKDAATKALVDGSSILIRVGKSYCIRRAENPS